MKLHKKHNINEDVVVTLVSGSLADIQFFELKSELVPIDLNLMVPFCAQFNGDYVIKWPEVLTQLCCGDAIFYVKREHRKTVISAIT